MYPIKDANEREQIEWVFGLTGGELADKPLRYATIEPRMTERIHVGCGKMVSTPSAKIERHWARYFYDGVPDYAREIDHKLDGMFVTIVSCELFGAMPRVIYAGGKRWRRVATFRSSGETECPARGEEADDRCPLCECDVGEDHGMIYIGDGWAEAVYRARD